MNPEVSRAGETRRGAGGEALRASRGEAHRDPCQARGRQVPGAQLSPRSAQQQQFLRADTRVASECARVCLAR